jgi:branched-chain amino acid transport system permease protein
MLLSSGANASVDDSTDSDPTGARIVGSVLNEFMNDDGEKTREPIQDIRILVSTSENVPVGEAVTNDDGKYLIPVPAAGTYTVSIDKSTLPEGIEVLPDTPITRAITVNPESQATSTFFLGGDFRVSYNRWSLLPQALFNGIKLAAILAITSIGLALIYATTGLSNFTHGEMVTFGAIMTWVANRTFGLHFTLAIIVGVILGAASGLVLEKGIWLHMRRRSSSLTSMMITSIGLALGLRYVYQFYFGASSSFYSDYKQQREWDLGPFSATPRALSVLVLCALVVTGVCLWLLFTRQGRAIRAVADNPSLASSTGINSDKVIGQVWMIGGGLAAFGGSLYGLEIAVRWDMGNVILLLMFAAITLGGLSNPFGALLGSFIIGIFVELWAWLFPQATELKIMGALFILIAVLLFKPQGVLGRKERIG